MRQTQEIDFRQGINQDIAMSQHPQNKLFDLHNLRIIGRGTGEDFSLVNEVGNQNIYNFNSTDRNLGQLYYFNPETLADNADQDIIDLSTDNLGNKDYQIKVSGISKYQQLILNFNRFYSGSINNYFKESGSCGDYLKWAIYVEEGRTILVISEDNTNIATSNEVHKDMADFVTPSDVPWKRYSSNITDVCIITDITHIGKYAFTNCMSLENIITLNNSSFTIGYSAFFGCKKLAYFDFDVATSIGESAFEGCTSLKSLNINTSNTIIGSRAFYGCNGLQTVNITFNNSGDTTQVGSNAFYGCTGTLTTNNNIPSINSLRSGVFSYSAFSNITIIDAEIVGNFAFSPLQDIQDVPCKVSFSGDTTPTTVGQSAFAGRHNYTFTTIPNTITTIQERAFEDCWGINMLDFRDRVVTIGTGAFNYCIYLQTLYLGYFENQQYSIGQEAFAKCGQLTNVYVDAIDPSYYGLSTAGNIDVFKRAIEDFASIDNYQYTSLSNSQLYCPAQSINSYTEASQWKDFGMIGSYAPITGIMIEPTSVGTMTEKPIVFTATFSPAEATAPIEWRCFEGTSGVESQNVTKTPSGNTCTIIFNNVGSSQGVYRVQARVEITPGTYLAATSYITVAEETISGSCGAHVAYSVYGDTLELEGNGPTNDYAMENVPWKEYFSIIKKVKISNGITYLGNNLFYACSSVEEFVLPESITSVSNSAFTYCKGAISINSLIPDYNFVINSLLRHVILGENITTLPNNAFYNAPFSTIEFKGNITSIGDRAFQDCINLIHFNLVSSNTVTFGDSVFEGCSSLITFEVDASVNAVGTSLFARCHNLSRIRISQNGTITAPHNALVYNGSVIVAGCKNSEITHSVADYAFDGNEGIEELFITSLAGSYENGYTIGSCAFRNCTNLKRIYFGGKLADIKDWAFQNCRNLDTVVFTDFKIELQEIDGTTHPVTVSTLSGINVFENCSNLSKVYSQSRIPINISNNFFAGINSGSITCYIPYCSSTPIQDPYTEYESNNAWKELTTNFNTIQQGAGYLTVNVPQSTYYKEVWYKLNYTLMAGDDPVGDNSIPFIELAKGQNSQGYCTEAGRFNSVGSFVGTYYDYANDSNWSNCYNADGKQNKIERSISNITIQLSNDEVMQSGYCGTDLQYAIIETTNNDTTITTMYLIGADKMSDYSLWWYPWKEVEANIDDIDISNSLATKYAYHTFRYTNALNNGVFSDGTLVNASSASGGMNTNRKIAAYAFYNNTSITEFEYTGTSIGYSAFEGCSNLSDIEISNVNSIFETFGDYSGCFTGCNSLIKADLTAAAEGTGSIEVIPYGLFTNCDNLKYIYLPNSVTYLDSVALNCKSLERIKCFAETPPILPYSLTEPENLNIDIYVPSNKVDAYKEASGWSVYSAHIYSITDYTQEDTTINARPAIYNEAEERTLTLNITNTNVSINSKSLILIATASGFMPDSITWASSNTGIATVDNGLVTFHNLSPTDTSETVIITATAEELEATCTINLLRDDGYKTYENLGLKTIISTSNEDNINTITVNLSSTNNDETYSINIISTILNTILGNYGFNFTSLGEALVSINSILNSSISRSYTFLSRIESGAAPTYSTSEKCTIIGAQTIGEYLVLFIVAHIWATPLDPEDPREPWDTGEKYDYIIRLTQVKKTQNTESEIGEFTDEQILYKGNLNFSEKNPIESIAIYETNDIQKVYWIDGRNQPRVINIVSNTINQTNNDTQFNFFRTFNKDSIPEIDIISQSSSNGSFKGGVIHYIITYVSKRGSESAVVYLSPAQYIWKESNFGSGKIAVSSEDSAQIEFKITINNIDTNYDKVKIYRAHRSDSGSSNTVLVTEQEITSKTFSYIDTGASISDSTLFDGGSITKFAIIPNSIAHKDNVLFFGNIKQDMNAAIKNKNIAASIQDYIRNNAEACSFILKKVAEDTEDDASRTTFTNYAASLTNSADNSYYQCGETYRFGVQFLYGAGQWSPVYYLGKDFTNDKRILSSRYNDSLLEKPMFKFTLPSSLVLELKESGFIGARLVYVVPKVSDRHVLCQGVLCSTLYNVRDREDPDRRNRKYRIYPSWFVRPEFKSYDALISRIKSYREKDGSRGQFLETRMTDGHHLIALPGAMFPNAELQLQPSGEREENGYIKSSYEEIGARDAFAIEKSVLDLYSPDLQFGDLTEDDLSKCSLRIVGYCTDKGFRSYTKVKATGLKASDKGTSGFINKDVLTISAQNTVNDLKTNNKFGGSSLSSFPYWIDGIAESMGADVVEDATFMIFTNSSAAEQALRVSASFPIYAWHTRQLGLNSNDNVGKGKISSKEMANIKTTWPTTYFDNLMRGVNTNDYEEVKFTNISVKYVADTEDAEDKLLELPDPSGTNTLIYCKKVKEAFIHGLGNKKTPIYARTISFVPPEGHPLRSGLRPIDPYTIPELRGSLSSRQLARYSDHSDIIIENEYENIWFGYTNKYCSFYDIDALFKVQGSNLYPSGTRGISKEHNFGKIMETDIPVLNTNDAVTMNYRSVSHAVIRLPKDKDNKRFILPKLASGNLKRYLANPDSNFHKVNTYTNELTHYGESEAVNFYPNTFSEFYGNGLSQYIISTPNENGVEGNYYEQPYYLIGELYREEVTNQYGGTDESDLLRNTWAVCSDTIMFPVDNKIVDGLDMITTEGDTYFNRYDILKTYPMSSAKDPGVNDLVEVLSITCESKINVAGRYDDNINSTDTDLPNLIKWRPSSINKINRAYSLPNNLIPPSYIPEDASERSEFPNQIIWSDRKNMANDVDDWTNIPTTNTMYLDGDKGAITSLQRFGNEIYAFQERGISRILYNSRTMIPSSDNMPIELSNAGNVEGKYYISESIGCQNKWSIANTPYGIYFVDDNFKDIWLFNGKELQNVSKLKGMSSWVNANSSLFSWDIEHYNGIRSLYDQNTKEVHFMTKDVDNSLAYNEDLGAFSGFYSYGGSDFMFSIGEYTYQIKDGSIWRLRTGNRGMFFNEVKPYSITAIVNGSDKGLNELDKIFETVDFIGDTYRSGELTADMESPFTHIRAWNEYQDTTTKELKYTPVFDKSSYLKRKFRTWRVQIPRNTIGHGKRVTLDRIRNQWSKIELSYDPTTLKQSANMPKSVIKGMKANYFIP